MMPIEDDGATYPCCEHCWRRCHIRATGQRHEQPCAWEVPRMGRHGFDGPAVGPDEFGETMWHDPHKCEVRPVLIPEATILAQLRVRVAAAETEVERLTAEVERLNAERQALLSCLQSIQAELDADGHLEVWKPDLQRHLDALDAAGVAYLRGESC